MCTITYLPDSENARHFVITSNRDESIRRAAEKPKIYHELDTQLYYPRDKQAGGTWIGISKGKRFMSLMNGAFQKYDISKTYAKSRGVVLKDLLSATEILTFIEAYDFRAVAPFFSLLFSWESGVQIYEIVWDGERIYLDQRDERNPAIWSSRMSYSSEQHKKKEQQFQRLLKENERWNAASLWGFHHEEGKGEEEGVLINRGAFRTTYISQFEHAPNTLDQFKFEDLLSGEQSQEVIVWED